MDLEELLRAARDNEPRAWKRLTPALRRRLNRFFRGACGEADADDLTQETFEIIVKSLPGFMPKRTLTAWVFGIARNLVRARLRARYRDNGLRALVAQVVPPTNTSPTGRLSDKELLALVLDEIERLPPYYRRAVELELQGASIEVHAQQENITAVAARGRRHRAHKLLQRRLSEREQPAAPIEPSTSTPSPS